MEKAKIRPLATPKPLYRPSPKLTGVKKVLDGTRQAKFRSDRVSVPQIRDFAVLLG